MKSVRLPVQWPRFMLSEKVGQSAVIPEYGCTRVPALIVIQRDKHGRTVNR